MNGWYNAREILAQNGNKLLVSWDDIDGNQWEPTWVYLTLYETHLIGLEKGLLKRSSRGLGKETEEKGIPQLRLKEN